MVVTSLWKLLAKISTLYILAVLAAVYITFITVDNKLTLKYDFDIVAISNRRQQKVSRNQLLLSWKRYVLNRQQKMNNTVRLEKNAIQYYGNRYSHQDNEKFSKHNLDRNAGLHKHKQVKKIKTNSLKKSKSIVPNRIEYDKNSNIRKKSYKDTREDVQQRIKQMYIDLEKYEYERNEGRNLHNDDDNYDSDYDYENSDVRDGFRGERFIDDYHESSFSADSLKYSNIKEGDKLILLYTPLFGRDEWDNLYGHRINSITKKLKCPISNCVYTYNKRLYKNSSTVVFHIPDQPNYGSTFEILKKYGKGNKHQQWVFFTSEAPNAVSAPRRLALYDDVFNLTMTYDLRSDIYLPYGKYMKLKSTDKRNHPSKNYAKGRKNKAVWFISNCDMRKRKWLASELGKYIDIDVGGDCEYEFPNRIECKKNDGLSNIKECKDIITEYKYYLSFESRYCQDYITEKYWDNAITNNVLPIVLGGADYNNPKIAIPGSYIDAQKFKSVQELGEYLQKLNSNDKEYNKYFQWKQKYKVVDRKNWPYTNEWVCDLCKKVNEKNKKPKSYSISDWWNRDKLCDGDRDRTISRLYNTYWKDYQVSHNISESALPLDDNGNINWDYFQDIYVPKPDNKPIYEMDDESKYDMDNYLDDIYPDDDE